VGEGQLPIKAVLLVTHNIEEAVQMCDRLLDLLDQPRRVESEIPIDLPQPRHTQGPALPRAGSTGCTWR
jgi:NitT/TauT family transport system ATP-binding protein